MSIAELEVRKKIVLTDARDEIKEKPHHNDGCKCRAQLGSAERLDNEEEHQNSARDTDHGWSAKLRVDDPDALDGTENRLRWRKNTIGHDHRDTKNANYLQNKL